MSINNLFTNRNHLSYSKELIPLVDKELFTQLHLACLEGNIENCKKYLNSSYINAQKGFCNLTPLHLVIEYTNYELSKQMEIIKLLISNGANLHIKDKYGETAFYKACNHVRKQVLVPYLIDLGVFIFETSPIIPTSFSLELWLINPLIDENLKLYVKSKVKTQLEDLRFKFNINN
jgi:ankyrin repeat protein